MTVLQFSNLTGSLLSVTSAGSAIAASTACQAVWVGAPIDETGTAQNTLPVFIGNSVAQALGAQGGIVIIPSNFEGTVIFIDNVNKLFARANDNNQKLAYRIFI